MNKPLHEYFDELYNQVLKPLFNERNKAHGNSWAGRTGEKGIFAQIERKTDRLYNTVWLGNGNNEDAKETLKDLIIYAMALYVYLEHKKE